MAPCGVQAGRRVALKVCSSLDNVRVLGRRATGPSAFKAVLQQTGLQHSAFGTPQLSAPSLPCTPCQSSVCAACMPAHCPRLAPLHTSSRSCAHSAYAAPEASLHPCSLVPPMLLHTRYRAAYLLARHSATSSSPPPPSPQLPTSTFSCRRPGASAPRPPSAAAPRRPPKPPPKRCS